MKHREVFISGEYGNVVACRDSTDEKVSIFSATEVEERLQSSALICAQYIAADLKMCNEVAGLFDLCQFSGNAPDSHL